VAATRGLGMLRPPDFRGFRLDVAARGIVREYNRALRRHGLSYVPYFVLLVLADDDAGRRPSDIAAELHLDGSSLSGHLDKLEAAGVAERRPDSDDRRVIRVHATEAGRRLAEELEPIGRALSELDSDLAPDALARVERIVHAPAPLVGSASPARTFATRPRAGLVTTLRAVTLTVPRSTVGLVLTRFAALVAESSGGAIRIELELPSRAPGGELQTLVDVRSGDVALAAVTAPVVGNLIPDAQLLELPYLLDSFAHGRAFCDGPFGAAVLAGADAFGLAGLGFVENGFRNVSTADVAARDPAQLAGLRLRVQQSPINVHLAEAFGAIAVPLPFPRLAEALAAREIDAQENTFANAVGLEIWRHQRFLIETRHALSAHVVLANTEILAALGAGGALVRDAMRAALAEMRADAERLDEELRDELARRMTFITLDDAARDRFVAATRLVHERMARALGEDALARALAASVAARFPLAS
jgi:TRAP-type C4-dicarboxylate transport system substrate-binding protein/DNA-binding MarR family transcriptional regulator